MGTVVSRIGVALSFSWTIAAIFFNEVRYDVRNTRCLFAHYILQVA